MTMDNTEIVNSYRAAKDPKQQIQTLAELNLCDVQEIMDILTEAGEKVDKRWYSKKPKVTVGAGSKPAHQKEESSTGDGAACVPPASPTSRRKEAPATLSLSLTRIELVSLVRFLSDSLPVYLREADLSIEAIHGLTGAYLQLKGAAK